MSTLGKSYGWGTRKPATKEEALAMAAKGRREITPGVFGSRPGAPLASQDRIGALGVGGEVGTSDRRGNWDSFFRQHAPTRDELAKSASRSAPLGADDIAADEAFGGGTTPIPTTPDQHIAAAIADHTKWLGQQGIAFPPPPTPRNDPLITPAQFTPPAPGGNLKFVAPLAAGWDQWQGPSRIAAPVNPYATQKYQSPYGTAAVSYSGSMNSQPTLPASTKDWMKDWSV